MTWDIPSGAGLAIQLDMLPHEAPTLLQGQPEANLSPFIERTDNVAILDVTSIITPYHNILSILI